MNPDDTRACILRSKTRPVVSREDAGRYVAYPRILKLMEKAGWVSPSKDTRGNVFYDLLLLDHACDRLSTGEWPRTQRRAKAKE